MKATSNGVFQGDNPLDYALPLAIVQIVLVIILTRLLAFLMKPLRQPRVIAEIVVSQPSQPFSLYPNVFFIRIIVFYFLIILSFDLLLNFYYALLILILLLLF